MLAKYAPVGGVRNIWKCREPEVLVEGPAGTGKTMGILQKLYLCANKYEGMRGAIGRQTRASMTQTVLKTFENKVLPPSIRLHTTNQSYKIGASEIIVAGMDNPERLLSSEFDFIYINEGLDFRNTEILELLTTRLRNGIMPYHQLIVDVNPGVPTHPLNVRATHGLMKRIQTTHKDNPAYWDASRGEWTEQGERYMAILERLTGTSRRRFLEGVWSHEEGYVYDGWLDDIDFKDVPEGNVTRKADYIPNYGEVVWAIDDGYTGKIDSKTKTFTGNSHPRSILLCQLRKDGRLVVFYESYKIKLQDREHIEDVVKLPYPSPDFAAVDKSAAQLIGLLNRMGIATQRGASSVDESIKEMRAWVNPDKNSYRRVLVHPRCRHLRYEFASYRYGDNEKPIKEFDHGLDALRYLIWRLRYERV